MHHATGQTCSDRRRHRTGFRCLLLIACLFVTGGLHAETGWEDESDDPSMVFDDQAPLPEPLEYPPWFKESFLDLQEDLGEAIAAGKRGIIVYFGQKRCPYCKQLLTVNLTDPDIVSYIRKYYDFIPIDIWGIDEVTDPTGKVLTERDYAIREGTNFTPSLIFYDHSGKRVFRMRGYYPPYQFRAALEYVADGYARNESFPDYLERATPSVAFEPGDLIEEDFFTPPPFNLDRSRFPADRPLVVFFEQSECHACDILHGEPLQDATVRTLLANMESVQLDMWSDYPVVTPAGDRTTARQWARSLGLYYTPAMVFFDEGGHEVLRVDSVVQFYRLRNVLRFVKDRGYREYPTYQLWRLHNGF